MPNHCPCFLMFLLLSISALGADITPDGSTATTVSVNSANVTVVDIAPKNNSGVSHNRYIDFNVPAQGAVLRNPATTVNALTIINEVTSTNISRLEGMLRVQGSTAHVIIANPNGIVVDGGRFINTAGVALTTGAVSFENAPGATNARQNIVVTTSQGAITIGEGGLSGTMSSLDLIAKEIRVNGAVTLENVNQVDAVHPLQSLNIHAGETKAVFDTSLTVNDALENEWSETLATGASSSQVEVDITRAGSLRAGSIQIVVNDDGAGFKHAGDIYADGNSFILHSDGTINNQINADIQGGTITATATQNNDASFSGGHIVMDVNDLSVGNAAGRQAAITADNGSIVIASQGDVVNRGGVFQADIANIADSRSKGAITLDVKGDVWNVTESSDALAIFFARKDSLDLRAAGDVFNQSGRFISNQALTFDITGDLHNSIVYEQFAGRGELEAFTKKGSRLWYTAFLKRSVTYGVRIDFGNAKIPEHDSLIVANGDLSITANDVFNIGGDINANGIGNLSITADNLHNEAILTGKGFFSVTCDYACDRKATSTIQSHGGQINASDTLSLVVNQHVGNIGGRIFSINNQTITAQTASATAIDSYRAIMRPRGFLGLFYANDARLVRQDQGGSFISNMGRINLGVFEPLRIEGGVVQDIDGERTQGVELIQATNSGNVILRRHIGALSDIL